MSIPDPTIDQVTGLPLLNPNTPIQQIPLGADVFPFADLKASSQPARGPIYGDDIIPTSSLLSGQHPTLGNAQTVQTDGNHAAKVYVVNQSAGGGGSPIVTGWLNASSRGTLTNTAETWLELLDFSPEPKTFWGIQMTVSTQDATEYFTAVAVYLTNRHGSTLNTIPLLNVDVWACTTTVKPSFQYPHYSVFFPNGLSLANLFNPATDYPILAAIKTNTGTLALELSFWFT